MATEIEIKTIEWEDKSILGWTDLEKAWSVLKTFLTKFPMFTFRNGKKYEGDWVNGLFQGFGKLTFGDADQFGRIKYEGEWMENHGAMEA